MKKLLLALTVLLASPAFAQTATTSVQLDDLAAKIEKATAIDHNNDIAAWSLLKEPAKTYAGRTLNPNGAPNYSTSIDLASNDLRPPLPWTMAMQELIAAPPVGNSANRFYVAGFSYWCCGTPPTAQYPAYGLKWESGGQSRVNRASAIMVAALRGWAYVLRQNGR